MTELLTDLLRFGYWAAILGGVAWWIASLRKARRPVARLPREQAELSGLREAIDRDRRAKAAGLNL